MAPRKTAATEGDGRCPMLKLTIEKGPLSGQISEFKPGSRIQVGRVVRGNTLSIKEDGISSKHLLIQVDSSSEHWIITDLGSSNGTILNGQPIKPSDLVVLSEGDEIKIGETTSMRVTLEIAGESDGGNDLRKNTRRRGRNRGVELGVIPENTELGLGHRDSGKGDLGIDDVKLGTEGARKGGKNVRGRMTRGSMKDVISTDLSVIEQKVSTRRTRSSKKSDTEANLEVSEIKLANDEEMSEKVSVRRTRSSVKEKELVDLDVVDGKSKKKGGRGKTNVRAEKNFEEEKKDELNVGHEILQGKRNSVDLQNVIDGEETGREGENGTAGISGVEKGDTGTRKGQLLTDLEMMTLGEWFDFLEDYLPKQIIDATEELISDMKQKAKRLHDYKLQQMNAKEKGGAVVE